jgi:hypothetical protein
VRQHIQHVWAQSALIVCLLGAYATFVRAQNKSFVNFASGGYHSCGVRDDNSVECWGYNLHGQLGDGTMHSQTAEPSFVPRAVLNTTSSAPPSNLIDCANLFDGGWVRVRHIPSGKSWHPATDLLAGTDVYGDQNDDTNAWSIGFENTVPGWDTLLFATGDCMNWLAATKDAVSGGTYSNALRQILASSLNGEPHESRWYNRGGSNTVDPLITLEDWGVDYGGILYVGASNADSNYAGSLQHDGVDMYVRAGAPPVSVSKFSAQSLGLGFLHSCAVLVDKTVSCWGKNNQGELGDGNVVDSAFAVPVVGVTNVASLAVGIGYGYTCALLESGFVECWGSNQYGQRGVGDVAAQSYATTVTHADGAPFHDVKSLSGGYHHRCAVVANGALWCWK